MSSRKKNVLIIMSDEQRWDTLGCSGNTAAVTPNLDQLAERGTWFDKCFTPYPLCCPARTSLWTAQLPHRNHVVGNWRWIHPQLRDGGMIQEFADQGYHTIYTGKWHVPGTTPERLGFADQSAIPAVLNGLDRGRYIEEYRTFATERGYDIVPDNIENLTPKEVNFLNQPGKGKYGTSEIALEDHIETWQTNKLFEVLERRPDDKPFFAVVSYSAPHFPMIVPEPFDRIIDPEDVILPPNFCAGLEGKPDEVLESGYYTETVDIDEGEWRKLIAHYWGFCSLLDEQVGRIVQHLREENALDDTIIVYVSDHGDMMGSHGLNKKGYPLHYEEALRVPLIIVDPDMPDGNTVNEFVSLMDIIPTLAEATGVELSQDTDGQSFLSLIQSPTSPWDRSYVIAETFQFGGHENGHGKYTDPRELDADKDGMNLSIRTHTDKYIFRWNDIDEYYVLEDDPYENDNRCFDEQYADRIHELQQILIEHIQSTDQKIADLVRQRMLMASQA